MKNKSGELTTEQLITIIILIVSFSVILFFLFKLNLKGEISNKEICHNSVLMKSKSFSGALDCRTSYICISAGGDCDGFSETDKLQVDTSKSFEEIKNQTRGIIAEQMADCWWMFGEGKVDYIPFETSYKSYHCGICSVIKFNSDLSSVNGLEISYSELYSYLEKTRKDASNTYMSYIYPGKNLATLKQATPTFNVNLDAMLKEKINLNEKYNVVVVSEYQIPPLKDKHLGVYIAKSDELKGTKIDCKAFDITK